MEIETVILRYNGRLTPQIQKQIYGFLANQGFVPFANSTIMGPNPEGGELRYFVKSQDGQGSGSLKSRLEEALKELNLPIEIFPETPSETERTTV